MRKARAAWEQVRRLTRLPMRAKKQIVCRQLYPILYYGCEAFPQATEEMTRMSREWGRWTVGVWRGSANSIIEDLSGVEDLQWVMEKRIRWAASVYGRNVQVLNPIARQVLEPLFEAENVKLNWMGDTLPMHQRNEIEKVEWVENQVDEYSDGSRREGAAAGANTTTAEYLRNYATTQQLWMRSYWGFALV